jgi:hypothetical protein
VNARHNMQRIRSLVVAGSVFGLCIAIALGISIFGGGTAPTWGKSLFAIAYCAPFIVALVSTRVDSVAHQRMGWAIAAILSAVAGAMTIFSGVGIFFLALAVGYAWAVVASARARATFRSNLGDRSA